MMALYRHQSSRVHPSRIRKLTSQVIELVLPLNE